MRASRQLHFYSILALAAVLAFAACAGRARRTPDDTFVYVLESFVADLDPRYTNTSHETKLSRLVAPGLVTVDQPSLEPRLELAEKIEPVDALTWDVTVRDGIRFPDGTLLGARDVAYTFTSVLDPAQKATANQGFSERFAKVEALDDRRVRFHLRQPLATFVSDLEFGIVEEKAAVAAGGRWPGGLCVGAGAFVPRSVRQGEVVLERNPNYFKGPAPMKRIVVKTLMDANARLMVLVGGSADGAQNSVRLDLLADVAEKPRLKVETVPGTLLTYLMMRNDDPILADARVRRAIAHAIDRQKLIQGKLGGHAVLASGLLAPGHWAYEGEVERYGYDPALSRRLLDEAGYPDPDGAGPLPRFTLSYKTSSDLLRLTIARLIAQQLAEVGIAVNVRSFEFSTFFSDIRKGNFQLASLQTSEILEPDMHYYYFHSSRIPTPEQPDGGNRWRYRSAQADRLIEDGRRELDRAARKKIYAELQRLIARDVPIVPLWHEENVAVLNRDVEGYEVFPNARLSSLAWVRKK